MLPLWKKIALVCLFLVLASAPFILNLTFFWGKYLGDLLVLLVSVTGIIITIVGTIMHTIKLKKDNNTGLTSNWLYLQEEREKQKRFLPILYLLTIPTIALWIWIGSLTFNDTMLMTKDLPYVLNKNYVKVECYVKSNGSTRQSGYQHIQFITAIDKRDSKYIYINFEHQYKKIEEFTNYIIWYLPNTKLGVYAEKIP